MGRLSTTECTYLPTYLGPSMCQVWPTALLCAYGPQPHGCVLVGGCNCGRPPKPDSRSNNKF